MSMKACQSRSDKRPPPEATGSLSCLTWMRQLQTSEYGSIDVVSWVTVDVRCLLSLAPPMMPLRISCAFDEGFWLETTALKVAQV